MHVFTCGYNLFNHWYILYTCVYDVFACKIVLYILSYPSLPVGVMYLHARTFCALTHMTNIPVCAMYLHARTFCILIHTTFIPVSAIYLHARAFCTLTDMILYPLACYILPAWGIFISGHNQHTVILLFLTCRANFYLTGTIFYHSNWCLASH